MATLIDHLELDGRRLADAAESAGLHAAVPTCPQWAVEDLVRHLSAVHRWATTYLVADNPHPPTEETWLIAFEAPAGPALLEHFRQGHASLVAAARDCPPYRRSWTFLEAPSSLAFWSRRQAHETAVHRFDAEAAAAWTTQCDPVFAADGIDELLCGFYARPTGRLTSEQPTSLGVQATDVIDSAWTLRIGPSSRTATRTLDRTDCVVRGPAADLYRLLWNRAAAEETAVEVSGDSDVLELVRRRGTVTFN